VKNSSTNKYIKKYKVLKLDEFYANWSAENSFQIDKTILRKISKIEKINLKYKIKITAPLNNLTYYIDPNIPIKFQTIKFKLKSNKNFKQIIWYVNNKEYKIVDYPGSFRWQLIPGRYKFKAKIVYSDIETDPIVINVE